MSCIVLYDFVAEKKSDLPLEVGENIKILAEDGDWWHGENEEGLTGYFPSNYVKKTAPPLPPRPNENRSLPAVPDTKDSAEEDLQGSSDDDEGIVLAPPSSEGAESEKGAVARPISMYGTPLENGHLDFATSVKHGQKFSIDSCDAFDALMTDGFCVESKSEEADFANSTKVSDGDRVHVLVQAMTWDGAATTAHAFCDGGLKFSVGCGQVSAALDRGVKHLRVGESAVITSSPACGYGAAGYPPLVPPNSYVVYRVKLEAAAAQTGQEAVQAEGPPPLLYVSGVASRPDVGEEEAEEKRGLVFVEGGEAVSDEALQEAAAGMGLGPR